MGQANSPLLPAELEEFERQIAEVMPALYSWAYLRIGPKLRAHVDPQDIVQEVATRAFRRFKTFEPERAPFRAWTFRIAKYYLNEILRSAAVARHAEQAASSETPGVSQIPLSATNLSVRIARNDSLRTLLDYIAEAEPDEHELFLRCALQGEPCVKAARRMGLSEDAAQKRWLRFRERLQGRPWIEELLAEGA